MRNNNNPLVIRLGEIYIFHFRIPDFSPQKTYWSDDAKKVLRGARLLKTTCPQKLSKPKCAACSLKSDQSQIEKRMEVHRCRFVEWQPSPIVALAIHKHRKQNKEIVAVARENNDIELWNISSGWHFERVCQDDSLISSISFCFSF